MSASIHYSMKGSSSKKRWLVQFDNAVLPVIDLKRVIVAQQSELNEHTTPGFDLILTNAQTGERYLDESFNVPRNTTVTVRRVTRSSGTNPELFETTEIPITNMRNDETTKTTNDSGTAETTRLIEMLGSASSASHAIPLPHSINTFHGTRENFVQRGGFTQRGGFGAGGGNFNINHISSGQSGVARSNVAMVNGGRPQQFMSSRLPAHYICRRCHVGGHHIRDCPTNGDPEFNQVRTVAPTGIPSEFINRSGSAGEAGRLIMSDGSFGEMVANERAFSDAFRLEDLARRHGASLAQIQAAYNNSLPLNNATTTHTQANTINGPIIPPDLQCRECRKLLNDPVATPCCFSFYCRSCITSNLVRSGPHGTCPYCKQGGLNANDLQYNRMRALKVSAFGEQLQQQAHKTPISVETTRPKVCGRCAKPGHDAKTCPTLSIERRVKSPIESPSLAPSTTDTPIATLTPAYSQEFPPTPTELPQPQTSPVSTPISHTPHHHHQHQHHHHHSSSPHHPSARRHRSRSPSKRRAINSVRSASALRSRPSRRFRSRSPARTSGRSRSSRRLSLRSHRCSRTPPRIRDNRSSSFKPIRRRR